MIIFPYKNLHEELINICEELGKKYGFNVMREISVKVPNKQYPYRIDVIWKKSNQKIFVECETNPIRNRDVDKNMRKVRDAKATFLIIVGKELAQSLNPEKLMRPNILFLDVIDVCKLKRTKRTEEGLNSLLEDVIRIRKRRIKSGLLYELPDEKKIKIWEFLSSFLNYTNKISKKKPLPSIKMNLHEIMEIINSLQALPIERKILKELKSAISPKKIIEKYKKKRREYWLVYKILKNGPVRNKDIAKLTGIPPYRISQIIAQFKNYKLIKETGSPNKKYYFLPNQKLPLWLKKGLLSELSQKIFSLIKSEPGINITEIAYQLKIGKGSVRHIVQQLESKGLIYGILGSDKRARRKNLFSAGFDKEKAEKISLLKQPTWSKIYSFISTHQPCRRSEISKGLSLSFSSVRHGINILLKGRIVKEVKIGRRKFIITPSFKGDINNLVYKFSSLYPRLVKLIKENPGITITKLAQLLEKPKTTIQFAVNKLEKFKKILSKKSKKKRLLYARSY